MSADHRSDLNKSSANTEKPAEASATSATISAEPKAAERPVGAKTTLLVSLAVFSSRIMGLLRDMLLAHFFDKKWRDCFIVAFRTPNMLRDLFAEGALSTAFVTVFSKKMKTEGDQSAWGLAHKMLTLATLFMSLIALGGVLLAPVIVRLLTPQWPEWKQAFTVQLAQIMFPFILLVSLAALVMGMLNAKKVFGVPATASTFFNITSIAVGFGGGWFFQEVNPATGERVFGANSMIVFSIGTLVGGLVQLCVQLPSLRRVGYRFRWDRLWRRDEGVRKILGLMWPALIAGSAVQVNVLLNTIFASCLPEENGPVTWLNNAFRLMQLPLGMFGVAVATVTLPVISRAATDGINQAFRGALAAGNRLVLFLCLPSAAGLFLLAEPIVSLLFERGMFTHEETLATAAALRWYAIGLIFYSLIKVIQPAFTAIDRRFIPMIVALISVGLNAALNSYFVFILRPAENAHAYLALSTAIIAGANCTILYIVLRRLSDGLETKQLFFLLGKLALPTLAIGLISWASLQTVLAPDRWRTYGLLLKMLTLGVTIAAAASTYFAAASLCKVDEARQFMGILRRKIAGRRG